MGKRALGTLADLAVLLKGELRGPGDMVISRVVPVGSEDPSGIAFAETDEYLASALESAVGALIVSRNSVGFSKPALLVDSPRLAFFQLLQASEMVTEVRPGIHPTAVIDSSAQVSPEARIGPYVVVSEDAIVGAGVELFPFCYVGPRCQVSKNCRLLPGVVLYQDVTIGENTIVHSGAVLGADGFGFSFDGHRQVKVPQVGSVEIGEGVEIGANTTIDRATCGETVVSDGAKIDNLVQVGHNSRIGAHSVLAGQVGVSGSVVIGERVVVGGQTAFADHVTVTDDVALAGRTGVMGDVSEPGSYFGTPPTPIGHALRALALQNELPELVKRIRALEKEVERLKRDI